MRFISMRPPPVPGKRGDRVLDLLAVAAIVLEDHAHEVLERDAPSAEGGRARELLHARRAEEGGQAAACLREIACRGPRVLRKVIAFARDRGAVESFERRRVLA